MTTATMRTRGLPERLIDFLPRQGGWSMEDFDFFSSKVAEGPPLEFSHGKLVMKAMPLLAHALIVNYIRRKLELFVDRKNLGYVFSEGAEFRWLDLLARYPDVLFVSKENFDKRNEKAFLAIDLAIEVLSPSNRKEDLVEKRRDYALGGVSEYWIVDPKRGQITVLKLKDGEYVAHGVFKKGEKADSVLLNGFEIDVTEALADKR